MADPIILTVERHIDAPPEQVFDAWLDAEAVGKWLFATPAGVMERVELDPRVGGKFLIAERRGDALAEHFGEYLEIAERRGDALAEHFGEYLEIDRPHRLVFTFAAMRDAGYTKVAVTITPDGEGSLVALVHEMDAEWADYEAQTRQGWTMILDGLARTLGA